MNRQEGHPSSFASAEPSSVEDEVEHAQCLENAESVDDGSGVGVAAGAALGADDDAPTADDAPTIARRADDDDRDDWAIDDEDDGPLLTLVDKDDGPALENAFVGDVADDAAGPDDDIDADDPIEFDEGASYPRLASDGPADEDEIEDLGTGHSIDQPTTAAATGGMPEPQDSAPASQAVEGSVALNDLRETPTDDTEVEAEANDGLTSLSTLVATDSPHLAASLPSADADVQENADAIVDPVGSPTAIVELTDIIGVGFPPMQTASPVEVEGDAESAPEQSFVRLDDLRSFEADAPASPTLDDAGGTEYAKSIEAATDIDTAAAVATDLADASGPDASAGDAPEAEDAEVLAGLNADAAEPIAPDDAPASYQSHFLDDGDDEPEFVAHVEVPGRDALGTHAAATAAVGIRAVAEPVKAEQPSDEAAAEAAPTDEVPAEAVAREGSPSPDESEEIAETAEGSVEAQDESEALSGLEATEAAAETDLDDSAYAALGNPPRRRGIGKRKPTRRRDRSAVGKGSATGDEQAVTGDDDAPADYADLDDAAEAAAEHDAGDSLAADAEADTDADVPIAEACVNSEYEGDDEPDEDEELLAAGATGGGWTIPLLCMGIAVIACCLIIPQADANRRLAYERQVLRRDLESVQAQVATNDEFLRKLAGDPSLAERLAQRQMKLMRPNTKLLPVGQGDAGTSPFDLVQVTPPAPMDPYEPIGGRIAVLCYAPRTKLYLTGGGLFLAAAGLVLGAGGRRGGLEG